MTAETRSSAGHTSMCATCASLLQLELVEAGQALRERRPLRLVQRDLERRQPEEGALEPGRVLLKRHADLLEQLVAGHRRHLGRGAALRYLHQHRRRRLA